LCPECLSPRSLRAFPVSRGQRKVVEAAIPISMPNVMNLSSYRILRRPNNAAVFSVLVALTVGLVAISYPAGAARSATGKQHQSASGLSRQSSTALQALPKPPAVQPFQTSPVGGEGQW